MQYLIKNIRNSFFRAMVLSTLSLILLSGCSTKTESTPNGNICKNHANINGDVKIYVKKRYKRNNFVRFGILPISVPANFSGRTADTPDFGEILAQKLQAYILGSNIFSTVELIQKPEWPGKKEEFFGNNLTGLSIAKNMGLDFVMVGLLSPNKSIKEMQIYTKIIEVKTGITVFYGESSVLNEYYDETFWNKYITRREPSNFKFYDLTDDLVACHSKMILRRDDDNEDID